MRAAIERHSEYLGKALSDLPRDFVESSRVITPQTPFTSLYCSDRINILVDQRDMVTAILTG